MGKAKAIVIKPLKILFLANSGDIIGGGQISLLYLIKGLNPKNFRPYVVCPSKGKLVDEIFKLGIKPNIIRMESLRNLNIFSWLKTIQKLIKIIKKEKIDLVHSNGSRPTVYGGIAAKLTTTPLIWHVRIADSDKRLDRILAHIATKILVVSKAVKARFKWEKNKVIVVYNGIDLDKFNPSIDGKKIREEFKISANTPLVGIVGRLDRYKGHQYFLEAARKVINIIPETQFLIVGDGENRKKLENLKKKLGLNGNVIFTGNRIDIPEILRALNLLVMSSVSEGFGRSAAEAMACGKAVVASSVGGLSEIVEDGITGKLVPPQNPDALMMAILGLLNDNERAKRMGRAGRLRTEKMFSLGRNIRKTLGIYEQIISNQKEYKA